MKATNRRQFLKAIGIGTAALALPGCKTTPKKASPADKPNILWIYIEDTNPAFGCYGDKTVPTPNIDNLAKQGVRFDKAFMTAGVCSPVRSAIMTGMMQTTIGAHNHPSSEGKHKIYLPNHVKPLPLMFQQAGYYTANLGKTHYNFVWPPKMYDKHDKKMYDGQDLADVFAHEPFFVQLQLKGGKQNKLLDKRVDRAKVTLPPYYPDDPVIRNEWANHYDTIAKLDVEVGDILEQLKQTPAVDNTIVFLFSDHGCKMPRHKQFLYDGGIHVPLIITGSKNFKPGSVRKDLISGIDITATSLALALLPVPDYMEGRDLFAKDHKPRKFIVAARDRCDYTIDRIRAIRTDRYKYIKNFMTDRAYLQPSYKDKHPYMLAIKKLYKQGKLNKTQARFVSDYRPAEELYDLKTDPHEINNLAGDKNHQPILENMRAILDKWIKDTDDKGQYPESPDSLRDVYKRWSNRCADPAFDKFKTEDKK